MDEAYVFGRAVVTGSGKSESEGRQSTPVSERFTATAASPHAIEHRNEYSYLTCQGSGVSM